MLIMDGRGWTGEIIDLVHFDIEGKGDVVPKQLEAWFVDEVRDVPTPPGEEVIDAENFMSEAQQAFAEVAA